MVDTEVADGALFPERVGDRLRAARTKAGLDLSDIATKTRVPQRHLVAIEAGDYAALPAITYCIGFVRAYARAVGEDEVALAHDLRVELGQTPGDSRVDHADYDAADPASIPPKTLVWTAVGVALLVGLGYGAWRGGYFDGGGATAPTEEIAPTNVASTEAIPGTPAAAPAPATGQVLLTAKDAVWFRIYDKNDKVLFEGEKKAGESFAVPADAIEPMIRTGRADQIKVTVGGAEVAPLGRAESTVKDVGVSAASLSARPPVPAAPMAAPSVPAARP
jgi:cytoskeletal protein RodZ